MPISVNMFGLRLTSEVQKRWKNGQPPHRTTGVASASSSQGSAAPERKPKRIFQNMADMAAISSGAVNTRLIQKRRVMSRSSELSSAAAVTVRGSSAMPQIGHEPGPGRTISGCIGQVYSVRVAAGTSGSRAIPQDGHAQGFVARTSGHIAQT